MPYAHGIQDPMKECCNGRASKYVNLPATSHNVSCMIMVRTGCSELNIPYLIKTNNNYHCSLSVNSIRFISCILNHICKSSNIINKHFQYLCVNYLEHNVRHRTTSYLRSIWSAFRKYYHRPLSLQNGQVL